MKLGKIGADNIVIPRILLLADSERTPICKRRGVAVAVHKVVSIPTQMLATCRESDSGSDLAGLGWGRLYLKVKLGTALWETSNVRRSPRSATTFGRYWLFSTVGHQGDTVFQEVR